MPATHKVWPRAALDAIEARDGDSTSSRATTAAHPLRVIAEMLGSPRTTPKSSAPSSTGSTPHTPPPLEQRASTIQLIRGPLDYYLREKSSSRA